MLTAVAAAGSIFMGWSGGGCTGTGPCTLTLTAATGVAAIFDLQTFALTVSKAGTGGGTVTSTPVGITCGTSCSWSYASGTLAPLTATPAADSTFDGWSGSGCTGTGPCTVTLTAATAVTATFSAQTSPPTTTPAAPGSAPRAPAPTGTTVGTASPAPPPTGANAQRT